MSIILDLYDGYYISAYCLIEPLANLLQSSIRHDCNIALWKLKGEELKLVHFWELERTSGIKHHNVAFFSYDDFYSWLDSLLSIYSLTHKDIVSIIGLNHQNNDDDIYYLDDNINYHSLCHLYSSMVVDSDKFFGETILSLSLDAYSDFIVDKLGANKYFYSGAVSRMGQVTIFPVSSPAYAWATARQLFDIEEGTLMALAYASSSTSYEEFSLLDIYNRQDVDKTLGHIINITDRVFSYSETDVGKYFSGWDPLFSERDNKISMVMKIIQKLSIRAVDKTVAEIIEKFCLDPREVYFSISGGYALNCPTNTYITNKYGFKGQLTLPCVNDSGQAIGMGLKFFCDHGLRFNFHLKHAFYGDKSFDICNDHRSFIKSIQESCNTIIDDIIEAPIIWFDGRAEIGPRALGHRSIIADPRYNKSKALLNHYKQRQWWRPVAPIVIEEECDQWFEDSFPSPYMLNNFRVRQTKKSLVPAILHIDDTARVQTVSSADGQLYNIIKQFSAKTGIPILCNTSLNDRGEPIINTLDQALNYALRKGIRIVYANGNRLELYNHDLYLMRKPWPRENDLFTKYSNDENLMRKHNPLGLTREGYFYATTTPKLMEYDLENIEDQKAILKMLHYLSKRSAWRYKVKY